MEKIGGSTAGNLLATVGTVGTYLDTILAAHRAAAAGRVARLDEARAAAGVPRGFRNALAGPPDGGLHVIAEVKRRSPSKGDLDADLVPSVLAKSYADGGASCLSVLTDRDFFGGSPDDLAEAKAATDLPVLRKDFTVCEADVCDARLMGADAVLLIVAALDDAQLRAFLELARDLRLDALVEAHDEAEVERALEAGADLIGVNQRDLVTFEVDTDRAVRVASAIPDGVVVKVAESGIKTGADARRLAEGGYHAVLVGETLVTSADPVAALKELRLCS
ncbi:MAG: indole-3-glycerol phosphate synthase [Acidimicrobiaceae bacterium]|nr:indole-3-glycerol phosphate synthase [Acidimicrobiaceae bacterium]